MLVKVINQVTDLSKFQNDQPFSEHYFLLFVYANCFL